MSCPFYCVHHSSFESSGYSCRRTFFESFITTGTDDAARFFKYLVEYDGDFFGRDDQFFSMYAFLYGSRTSEQYLRSVYVSFAKELE